MFLCNILCVMFFTEPNPSDVERHGEETDRILIYDGRHQQLSYTEQRYIHTHSRFDIIKQMDITDNHSLRGEFTLVEWHSQNSPQSLACLFLFIRKSLDVCIWQTLSSKLTYLALQGTHFIRNVSSFFEPMTFALLM